jgi:hypothetical protein
MHPGPALLRSRDDTRLADSESDGAAGSEQDACRWACDLNHLMAPVVTAVSSNAEFTNL